MPPLTVTVNTASSPSSTFAPGPATLTVTVSSSRIVPVAEVVCTVTPSGNVTPSGTVSPTVNVSSTSFRSSSVVATVTVFSV